jgi:HlyD family secretion protein
MSEADPAAPNDSQRQRARRVRLAWFGAGALVALGVIASLWPRAAEADFVVIDRGRVRVELADEGRTRMHDVYVVSAPVAGRLLRVEVEPGDAVGAGAVVARIARAAAGFLDTRTDLQARAVVNSAAAGLRSADAQLTLAELEHARNRSLLDAKLVARAAVDTSAARRDAARAARDAAAADLERARSAVQPAQRMAAGMIEVRTPAAGRVLRVPQKSEAVVAVGTPLVDIGDPAHLEVVAEFLSQDAVRMRPGQRALMDNWGGAPLAAAVDRIEPVAHTKVSALGVEEQRTNVILQFEDRATAAALGHDYRVDARVTVEEVADAVRVPLGALFRNETRWFVYKVSGGRAVQTAVETGAVDNSYRAVRAGLAAGDKVILFPGAAIHDGARVKPSKSAK